MAGNYYPSMESNPHNLDGRSDFAERELVQARVANAEPFIQEAQYMIWTEDDRAILREYSREQNGRKLEAKLAALRDETIAIKSNFTPSFMDLVADRLDETGLKAGEALFKHLDRVEARVQKTVTSLAETDLNQRAAGALLFAIGATTLAPTMSHDATPRTSQHVVVQSAVAPKAISAQHPEQQHQKAQERAAAVSKLAGMVQTMQTQMGPKASTSGRVIGDAEVNAFLQIMKHPEAVAAFDVEDFKRSLTDQQLAQSKGAAAAFAPELAQLTPKQRELLPLMLALIHESYKPRPVAHLQHHVAPAPKPHAAAPKHAAPHHTAKPAPAKHKLNPHAAIPKSIAHEIEKQSKHSKHFTAAEIAAQIKRESSFRTKVESPAGATGLGQIMPGTWEANKIDGNGDGKTSITDPADNLATSIEIMDNLYEKFAALQDKYNWTDEDVRTATYMSYNVGPNKLVTIVETLGRLPTNADIGTHYTYTYGDISSDNVIKRETVEYPDKIQADVDDYTDAENNDDDQPGAPESAATTRVHNGEIPAAPQGTIDLGLHTGYHRVGAHGNGHTKTQLRLVAIPGFGSSSSESHDGSTFYINGANGNVIVNAEMGANILAMYEAAKADGIDLFAQSSFRSMPHQQALWRANPNRAEVAYPGRSNHQEGNAFDLALGNGLRLHAKDYDTLNGGAPSPSNPRVAPTSEVWKWMQANAHKYGLRQYYNEPWHWELDPNAQ